MNSGETSEMTKNDDTKQTVPVFVESETMFEKMAEVAGEIERKAYEFFQDRNGAFGSQLDDWFKAESVLLKPTPVEITETDGIVNVRAEVPGFKLEEIEVSVKDNVLILRGEAKSEEKKEDENTFYSERRSNRFCRQLSLPAEVDTTDLTVSVKEGILQMSLKKKAAEEAEKAAVKTA